MTRHYYHENLDALRAAVTAIPAIGGTGSWELGTAGNAAGGSQSHSPLPALASAALAKEVPHSPLPIPKRLKRLDRMFSKGLLTEDEFRTHRARILSEI